MSTLTRVADRYVPLAPLDAGWSGLESVRVLDGLVLPTPERVRAAVRLLHETDDLVARDYDIANLRYRVARADERDQRCASMVLASRCDRFDADDALQEAEAPLGPLPFRLVVGPTWCSIRMSHAFGDGWSCLTLLGHLLRQATSSAVLPLPWDVLGPRRQNLLSAGGLVRRPGALLTAARHRRTFSGGHYEPAALRADGHRPTTVVRTSPPGYVAALGRERDLAWPGASLAGLVLVRLRAALAERVVPPDEGVEMLFDVRRDAAATRRAFGNWAAGITVRPADDDDPVSVTAEIRRIRESGVPHVAAAASRLRARGARAGGRQVLAPGPRAHLTLSYLNRHGPLAQLPWDPDGVPVVGLRVVPNGLGTISVSAHEAADRLSLSVSFYDHVWPRDAVTGAVESALRPPPPTPPGPRRPIPEEASP